MSSAGILPPESPPAVYPVGSPDLAPLVTYASWSRRVVAALLDYGILAGVTWLALGEGAGAPWLSFPFDFTPTPEAVAWNSSLWVVATVVLMLGLQGDTGWTPGKLVAGIVVVRDRDLRPAGFVRSVLRVLLHLFDAILLIGYLRPLWNRERRTFADSIMRTVVVRRRPGDPDQPLNPRWGYALTAAALVACLLGWGFTTPTASGGGLLSVATGRCAPVGPGGEHRDLPDVQLEVEETFGYAQRLWIRRDDPPSRAVTAQWSWGGTLADAAATGALRVTAWRPGSDVVVTQQLPLSQSEFSDDVAEIVDDGTGALTASLRVDDPALAAGDTLAIRTELLDDAGDVLATCQADLHVDEVGLP